jgi:hypothetical protein
MIKTKVVNTLIPLTIEMFILQKKFFCVRVDKPLYCCYTIPTNMVNVYPIGVGCRDVLFALQVNVYHSILQ